MTDYNERINRTDVLREYISGVSLGEVFPTVKPYTHDERIGECVGVVYYATFNWIKMHCKILYPVQLNQILNFIEKQPNGKTGLYCIIDCNGKEILYTDNNGQNQW